MANQISAFPDTPAAIRLPPRDNFDDWFAEFQQSISRAERLYYSPKATPKQSTIHLRIPLTTPPTIATPTPTPVGRPSAGVAVAVAESNRLAACPPQMGPQPPPCPSATSLVPSVPPRTVITGSSIATRALDTFPPSQIQLHERPPTQHAAHLLNSAPRKETPLPPAPPPPSRRRHRRPSKGLSLSSSTSGSVGEGNISKDGATTNDEPHEQPVLLIPDNGRLDMPHHPDSASPVFADQLPTQQRVAVPKNPHSGGDAVSMGGCPTFRLNTTTAGSTKLIATIASLVLLISIFAL